LTVVFVVTVVVFVAAPTFSFLVVLTKLTPANRLVFNDA
jgi:hypothetical protein